MKTMDIKETFRPRAYGHTELALAYCPHLTGKAAWAKLRQWIMLNPRLRAELTADGRLSRLRTFTPREVALIAEELGEP